MLIRGLDFLSTAFIRFKPGDLPAEVFLPLPGETGADQSTSAPSCTSPRTHMTSHVAPPTYFCKPPCVWKYGGPSDTTCIRPKFIAQFFHVTAMNKYVNRGVGNEECGGCKPRKGLPERSVGLRLAELPRLLCASVIEVPVVRVPQGKKLLKTGRVDTEV